MFGNMRLYNAQTRQSFVLVNKLAIMFIILLFVCPQINLLLFIYYLIVNGIHSICACIDHTKLSCSCKEDPPSWSIWFCLLFRDNWFWYLLSIKLYYFIDYVCIKNMYFIYFYLILFIKNIFLQKNIYILIQNNLCK